MRPVHRNDGHRFERLEKMEDVMVLVASAVGILVALAMAAGLILADGHVTW